MNSRELEDFEEKDFIQTQARRGIRVPNGGEAHTENTPPAIEEEMPAGGTEGSKQPKI